MDLQYNIPYYNIEILKINNNQYKLEIFHKNTQQTREYTIDDEIGSIYFDDLRLILVITFATENFLYLNFEDENNIIGDIYDELTEEHLDVFMIHNFNE